MPTVQELVAASANKYGVPVALGLAVAKAESNFSQSARSPKGAIGVMQLMPATASELGVNPYNLSQNIEGGMRYLAQMFNLFGTWETAVAAYNAGPGNIQRGIYPSETRNYVSKVFSDIGSAIAEAIPDNQDPGSSTFSIDVYDKSINFPIWVLAIGVASLLWYMKS